MPWYNSAYRLLDRPFAQVDPFALGFGDQVACDSVRADLDRYTVSEELYARLGALSLAFVQADKHSFSVLAVLAGGKSDVFGKRGKCREACGKSAAVESCIEDGGRCKKLGCASFRICRAFKYAYLIGEAMLTLLGKFAKFVSLAEVVSIDNASENGEREEAFFCIEGVLSFCRKKQITVAYPIAHNLLAAVRGSRYMTVGNAADRPLARIRYGEGKLHNAEFFAEVYLGRNPYALAAGRNRIIADEVAVAKALLHAHGGANGSAFNKPCRAADGQSIFVREMRHAVRSGVLTP